MSQETEKYMKIKSVNKITWKNESGDRKVYENEVSKEDVRKPSVKLTEITCEWKDSAWD